MLETKAYMTLSQPAAGLTGQVFESKNKYVEYKRI